MIIILLVVSIPVNGYNSFSGYSSDTPEGSETFAIEVLEYLLDLILLDS